jgi:hypothetical protein
MATARKRADSASVTDQPAPALDTFDHRDRIALRAYELYLARGGADGRDFDDWLAAEREMSGSNVIAPPEDAGE